MHVAEGHSPLDELLLAGTVQFTFRQSAQLAKFTRLQRTVLSQIAKKRLQQGDLGDISKLDPLQNPEPLNP